MRNRAERRRELFIEAFDLPVAQRADFLGAACADLELRNEVLDLLAVTPPDNFLEPLDLTTDPLLLPTFGPYDVVEGAVPGPNQVLARHNTTGNLVTIEVQVLRGQSGGDGIAAFARAAHGMNQLRHPNSVPVYEHGWRASSFWLARECIDGHDLGTEMALQLPQSDGPVPAPILPPSSSAERLPALLAVFESVVDVLRAAHDVGICHGDLGPHRVVLDRRGQAYVTGFGMAAVAGSSGSVAADLAALGRLLHDVLRETPYQPPSTANTGTAPRLDRQRLAELEQRTVPNSRRPYAEAKALLEDLRLLRSGLPAEKAGWWQSWIRWLKQPKAGPTSS